MLIEARIGSPPKLISCESYVAEVTSYASHTPALPVDNGHGFSSTAFSANIVRHGAWAEMAGTVQGYRAGSPAGGGQSRPCPRDRHRATGVNSIGGSVLSRGHNPRGQGDPAALACQRRRGNRVARHLLRCMCVHLMDTCS